MNGDPAGLALLAVGALGLALTLLAGAAYIWIILYLTTRLREIQAKVDKLRADRAKKTDEIAELERRLQVTYIENAMLSAKKDASQEENPDR